MKHQIALLVLLILFLIVPSADGFAHGGGTDSNGGHYDHSTGQYHYHHGYSAHQHPNGICPYDSRFSTNKGSSGSSNIVITPKATATPKRVFNTVFYVKTPTPAPAATKKVTGSTSQMASSNMTTQTSIPTSKVRPAVTVAPGEKVTPTPRPTVKPTATPRITATPTQRPTASTSTPMYVADDTPHVWYYLMLGSVALFSICVAVHVCRSRSREVMQNAVVTEHLKNQVSKLISDEANAKEELQHAYAEMAKLEQKLHDAYARIDKLKVELETSHAPVFKEECVDPTPPPVFIPKPLAVTSVTPGDISPKTLYMIKYPQTWRFIKNNALVPDSYVNYYHSIWGRLQAHHGDGLVFNTLTDEEQSYVDYPPVGKNVYLASVDSDTYHTTPNCYTLLRSNFIEVDSSLAIVYRRCTKCVPPNR